MNYGDCIGCGLCVMGCPSFEDTHSEALTAKGWNRALQAGFGAADLADVRASCTLCGYCEAVCPREVRNVEIALSLGFRIPNACVAPAEFRDRCCGTTVVDPRCYWRLRRAGTSASWLGAQYASRAKLRPTDLYVVPAILVNLWHDEFYPVYHALRERTGARTNLDLNRLARSLGPDPAVGVRRMIERARPARIVTCSAPDFVAFRDHSGIETRFITECV